jgi:tetratricopeptide (TPR) repeat protein
VAQLLVERPLARVLVEGNTPYTQLFLTHIDAEGNSTPPVVLERFTGEDRAANIPEFVPIAPDAMAKIQEQFLDAYSFLRAGMANERTSNYPGAVRLYQRGLEIEPNNVELLNAMGFALFQQGKSREAVAELEKAVAIDPKHVKARNNLALAAIDAGELELAEAHYRESLAIKPDPAIYNDLGFVLERMGMSEDAEAAYRKALALDPKSSAANYNLGASLVRQGRTDEAIVRFKAALEADPKNTAAQQALAQALMGGGRAGEKPVAPSAD